MASKPIPPHLRKIQQGADPKADSATDIRHKLSSLGVTVDEARPARKPSRSSASTKQPTSPMTSGSQALVFRGRGGRNQRQRKSPTTRNGVAWLSNKDIPKPDPKRWETDWVGAYNEPQSTRWDGESTTQSIESALADCGGGNGGYKNVQVDEDEWAVPGDGWDAGLPRAPLDWDYRPAFRPDQSQEQIKQWLQFAPPFTEELFKAPALNLDSLSTADGITYIFGSGPPDKDKRARYEQMGTIVHPEWLPENLGRMSPQTFWREIIKSTEPEPYDSEDLLDATPWWDTKVMGGIFLSPPPEPLVEGIDPTDESDEQRMKREADQGSNQHSQNRTRFEVAKRNAGRQKQIRKDEKTKKILALKDANNGVSPVHSRPLRPGLKLHIRHARQEDMAELRDLYNYYVDFTCVARETEPVDTADMMTLFKAARDRDHRLPFLVAYEKGEVLKGRGSKRLTYDNEPIVLPDKLVGFAFANEHVGPSGNMYRFTVDLEVYTHKDRLMKGVASCLIDKILAMLDPEHLERGGYDVLDYDLIAAKPIRVVKNVLIKFPHDRPERHEWVSRWLAGFDFRQVGYISGIGTKLERKVHLATYHRTTVVAFDDAEPPDVMAPSQNQD